MKSIKSPPEPQGPQPEHSHTITPVAVVSVRGPLRKLAGGRAEHELEGATVVELLRGLESRHPAVGGWILDERGLIRRHINVFVNGEQGDETTAVRSGDRIEVVMSNGSTLGLTVTSAGLVAADLVPSGHFDLQGAARVTLVTCAGAWDTGQQVYTERFVVEASPT